jgi:hypothetical protein
MEKVKVIHQGFTKVTPRFIRHLWLTVYNISNNLVAGGLASLLSHALKRGNKSFPFYILPITALGS